MPNRRFGFLQLLTIGVASLRTFSWKQAGMSEMNPATLVPFQQRTADPMWMSLLLPPGPGPSSVPGKLGLV